MFQLQTCTSKTGHGGWDILFLGRCHDHCERDKHIGADVFRVFNPACLHAYAVTRYAAKTIIEAARQCHGDECPIDNVVRSLIRGTGSDWNGENAPLVAYAVSPQLFTQESKSVAPSSPNTPFECVYARARVCVCVSVCLCVDVYVFAFECEYVRKLS